MDCSAATYWLPLPAQRGEVERLRTCDRSSSLRGANGSGRSGRPDDRLRDEAIQGTYRGPGLLRFARNDEIKSPSRNAFRARGMPYNASRTSLSTIASRLNRRWDPVFGSTMLKRFI